MSYVTPLLCASCEVKYSPRALPSVCVGISVLRNVSMAAVGLLIVVLRLVYREVCVTSSVLLMQSRRTTLDLITLTLQISLGTKFVCWYPRPSIRSEE